MSCLRRPSPAVKTPLEDDDDLLGEILLRLPPQSSSLPRASSVCKRWRSLAADPGFSRRFRRHHRHNPPLLGFFDADNDLSFIPTLEAPNRVPPGRFSLQPGDGDRARARFRSLGCRHGLVLILDIKQMHPVTGDKHRLAIPPGIADKRGINGAVLRVGDAHFQAVLTVVDSGKQHTRPLACVYSSETGIWGDLISSEVPVSHHPIDMSDAPILVSTIYPAVLAENSFYWTLDGNFVGILEFNLAKQSLAVPVIRVPEHMLDEGDFLFWILRAEGGGLGLFFWIDTGFQLWKRNTDSDGVASWGIETTIELDKLFSLNSLRPIPIILGFVEDNSAVFMWRDGILFMVHLESLLLKKPFETNYLPHYHPFEDVYTAGI